MENGNHGYAQFFTVRQQYTARYAILGNNQAGLLAGQVTIYLRGLFNAYYLFLPFLGHEPAGVRQSFAFHYPQV